MYFLVDNNLKIIFGWSAKAGCSHIKKIFWYLQTGNDDYPIHTIDDHQSLPQNISNYTIILIIRNPFERLVSGFVDKYNPNSSLYKSWKNEEITFSKFIKELSDNNYSKIDKHHFTPQTSEKFKLNIIEKSKKLIIYDLKNIDYSFIENLYGIKIPEKLINFRGNYFINKLIQYENYVFDMDIKQYYEYKIPIKYFYNEELKNNVYKFYLKDFLFFNKYGFNYKIMD